MNLLLIDLETTGLDAETNGILSICAKLYSGDRKVITSYYAECTSEDSKVDLAALKVNRYSISKLQSFKNEKETMFNFCDWLISLPTNGEIVLCGHNVHFDIGFIKSKLRKYNISGFDQAVSHRVIDTASIGRFLTLTGHLQSKVTLKDLATSLEVQYDPVKHHNAEYDVDLTASVLFKMIDTLKGIPNGENKQG